VAGISGVRVFLGGEPSTGDLAQCPTFTSSVKSRREPLPTSIQIQALVAECPGAADRGQHLLIGSGVATNQDLPAGVEGEPLHRREITGDGEDAGLGRRGLGDVWDPLGNGLVDKRGGIGAGSSVHDIQIRGGAAVASIAGTLDAG
jgi:hypothetical protein